MSTPPFCVSDQAGKLGYAPPRIRGEFPKDATIDLCALPLPLFRNTSLRPGHTPLPSLNQHPLDGLFGVGEIQRRAPVCVVDVEPAQ